MSRPESIHLYVRKNPVSDPEGATLSCPTCKERKPVSELYLKNARRLFAANGSSRGGCPRCRTCQGLRGKFYMAERVAIINAAKEGGCVDCGLINLAHPEIFDFDHVRGDKVKGVSQRLTSGTLDELREEISRCEVVCSNCHRIRTRGRTNRKSRSDLR